MLSTPQRSAKHADVDKVVRGYQNCKEASPDLALDGELQLDAAIVPSKCIQSSDSKVAGKSKHSDLPDLDAGNMDTNWYRDWQKRSIRPNDAGYRSSSQRSVPWMLRRISLVLCNHCCTVPGTVSTKIKPITSGFLAGCGEQAGQSFNKTFKIGEFRNERISSKLEVPL